MKNRVRILILTILIIQFSCVRKDKGINNNIDYNLTLDSIQQVILKSDFLVDSLKKTIRGQQYKIDSLIKAHTPIKKIDIIKVDLDSIENSRTVEKKPITDDNLKISKRIHFTTVSDQFFKVHGKNEYHKSYSHNVDYEAAYINRLSFSVGEIYYTLIIEKINYGLSEEDNQFIESRYSYSGFDIGELIFSYGRLVNLKFIKWIDYKSFVLQEGDILFVGILENNGNLKIKRLKKNVAQHAVIKHCAGSAIFERHNI